MADVVDENIDVVDDQSEVVDDQKDDEEPPESPRRGKWWGFSCRGELQGDDRADAIDDVGEAQSGKLIDDVGEASGETPWGLRRRRRRSRRRRSSPGAGSSAAWARRLRRRRCGAGDGGTRTLAPLTKTN